jgi:trk system potassium uptake protein
MIQAGKKKKESRWVRSRYKSGRRYLSARRLTPSELFVVSFLLLIIAGTLTLKFLPNINYGENLNWTDAAFTSTSAVCVTGLIVVDTATYFTPLGQVIILILIQLGGLGMLVLTSVIITALGGRPSLRTENIAAGARHMVPHVRARKLILDIVIFTFAFEAIGAIALYCVWAPKLGWTEAIWPSIFHAVSAFCNAGFSTNSSSLMEFNDSPITIAIVSSLVIIGGLGFITIEEIFQRWTHRKKILKRMSVHTKLVLLTNGVLLLVGWILFSIFEWHGVLSTLSGFDKLCNSFFMSVTPRTAGFNTIDYGNATDSSNFLTIILMTIGGSPGSTAGGLKTTTFALLGLLAWSRLRSRATVTFAHRSIPPATIQRATSLFVISIAIVVSGVFILASIGDFVGGNQEFLVRLFEIASAFNTVGLSMGITAELSVTSRWLIIVLMFVGRTGPLAIAAALIVRLGKRGVFRLAYEDVVVG